MAAAATRPGGETLMRKLGFAVLAASAAVSSAAAQSGSTVNIRIQPNLATQARDGYTVCLGTVTDRAIYGSKVTGSTGIVSFTGMTAGTSLVATVSKSGFTGRDQQYLVPAGTAPDVIITVFSGSGGPFCPVAAAPSSVTISVDPGAGAVKSGFYVCVGTEADRDAFGTAVTPAGGTVSFPNLPGNGMVTATIMRAGYAGAERDWYPTAGQPASFSLAITAGAGGYSCPGYQAPVARSMQA